jgi:hypothetical protein
MATDMVDLASVATEASVAPAAESASVATETPAASTDDFAVETAPEEGAEVEADAAGKETETRNADGTEKTTEQKEDFKAKAENRAPLPAEVRSALKSLRDADPKNAAAVKVLHGSYERWEAAKELLGSGAEGGVNGLKSYLADVGVKTLPEARATLARTQEMLDQVKGTDELLYSADPTLSANVYEDMKAQGKEGMYGKVVANFINHLKEADNAAFYDQVAKPLTLAGMDEAGVPTALNALHAALLAGDMDKAKAITKNIAKFYNDLRDEQGEANKVSRERSAWEEEKAAGVKAEQSKTTKEFETSVATDCEKSNNTRLGKSLGGFLRLPFFKDFPRETLVDLGNGIKENLYARLRADKTYQNTMTSMWKAKPTAENRAKMVQFHQSKLEEISDEVVRSTVQKRYPGYAKGGMAAGKAAAAVEKKVAAAKAGAASVATGKPIYVASKPENIVRTPIKVAGKDYSANDLQVMLITGKAFVKANDGKSVKLVTWRR